jgi:general secretion pathway protein C
MGFDAAFKRSFVLVVFALLAIAAYFQAKGMGQILAATIAEGGPGEPPPPRLPGWHPPPAAGDHEASADAILDRNPFDSITGPLRGGEPPPKIDLALGAREEGPCDSARVVLISESDDPGWSFASIADGSNKPVLRRVGDEVAGWSVERIAADRVWLVSKQARCHAVLGQEPAHPNKAAAAPSATPVARPGGAGGVPPDIAGGIIKNGPTDFTVHRGALESILSHQAELFSRLRVAPDKEGLRLTGVKPDSVLGMIGVENGDKLQRINGFDLTDPKTALEAYAKLANAERLTVTVMRAGKPMNIDIKID